MLKSNTTKKVLSLSRSRLYPLEIAVFDRNLSGHDVHQHMLGKVPKPEDVERETRRLVRGCTHAFSVVGASRKASDDVIEAVDGDLVKAFARGCRDAGTVGHFSLLSQHGAESSSSDVRLRAKGEAENTVLELGFPVTSIYRPYNLLTTLQRSKWKEILLPLLRPVTPPNLRSVSVGDLGKVMFQNASRIHVNVRPNNNHHSPHNSKKLKKTQKKLKRTQNSKRTKKNPNKLKKKVKKTPKKTQTSTRTQKN
ncbi:hypothetical protein AAMO2058_001620500 [Amorphochlora amoebiformis]